MPDLTLKTPKIEEWEIPSILTSLVDKSLVVFESGADATVRYHLLETVRRYADDRLAHVEGNEDICRRHALFFAGLAEYAYSNRFERESEMLEVLEANHDNIRAALESLVSTDRQGYLELAGTMGWFWHLRSHFVEGRAWLDLAISDDLERNSATARALAAAGEIAAWAGDLEAARPLMDQAISIYSGLGYEREVALALHELGWGYFFGGNDEAARDCMERSLDLQQLAGDPMLVNRARIGLLQVLVSIGDLETVEPMARHALDIAQQLGDLRSEHFAHHFLADCPLIRGECDVALARYRSALKLAQALGDRAETSFEIQGVAMAEAGLSHPQRALQLAGAASAEMEALAIDVTGIRFWSDLLNRYLGKAREDLTPEAAEASWNEGRAMTLEQAIALAFEEMV